MTRRKLFAGLDKVDEAEANVAIAKARLSDTIGGIKTRLKPANILADAIGGAKVRSNELADGARDLARRRPAIVAAGITGVALIVLHRPLFRAVRRLFSKR